MKTNSTQMEILILTGTSFSASRFTEKNEATGKPARTEKELLTEACWNGMLPEMFPEICEQIPEGKKMYLWEIKEADTFIDLELGEMQEDKDRYFSVNPYIFLAEQPLS
ncbi:MAG: hypothetical protein QM726_17385 [Chitinophagaceae bacterium]